MRQVLSEVLLVVEAEVLTLALLWSLISLLVRSSRVRFSLLNIASVATSVPSKEISVTFSLERLSHLLWASGLSKLVGTTSVEVSWWSLKSILLILIPSKLATTSIEVRSSSADLSAIKMLANVVGVSQWLPLRNSHVIVVEESSLGSTTSIGTTILMEQTLAWRSLVGWGRAVSAALVLGARSHLVMELTLRFPLIIVVRSTRIRSVSCLSTSID